MTYFTSQGQHQQRCVVRGSFPVRQALKTSDVEVTWQRFKEIDTDGDGILAFREAVAYLAEKGGDAKALVGNQTWWREMDTNNNEYLEPGEFDPMLL